MNEFQWRELVEQTKKGDRAAFEKLYKETQRSVYFTALKLLANEDNAKDVMQDSFMTALEKLDTLEDGAKFPQWINGITINKCRQYFRKPSEDSLDEQSEQGLELQDDDSFIPEEYVTDAAKRKIIMDIITTQLSDVQRQTVIMYYYNEMALEQIAQVMECPLKTVSSRLCSAREKIKTGVLSYEKKHGDKLHSIAVVPVLALILRYEAESTAVPAVSLEVLFNTLANATAKASATSATTTTAATAVAAGGSAAAAGLLTGKAVAMFTAAVIALGGATAGLVYTANSTERISGTASADMTPGYDVLAQWDEQDGQSAVTGRSQREIKLSDPDKNPDASGVWDIQTLSAVMESFKDKPIDDVKQMAYEYFGTPIEDWELQVGSQQSYHTVKVPGGLKVYNMSFDTLELIEKNGTGVVYKNDETVSLYKDYDQYNECATDMAILSGYLSNDLKNISMGMVSLWKTDSGVVGVSIDVGDTGFSGILCLGFRNA